MSVATRSHGWTVSTGGVLLVVGRDDVDISSVSGRMRVLHMRTVVRGSHGWVTSLIKRGGGSVGIGRLMIIRWSTITIRARSLNVVWMSSHGSWSHWVWCPKNILILIHNGGTGSGIQYHFHTFTHGFVFVFLFWFNFLCLLFWFLFDYGNLSW